MSMHICRIKNKAWCRVVLIMPVLVKWRQVDHLGLTEELVGEFRLHHLSDGREEGRREIGGEEREEKRRLGCLSFPKLI